MNTRARRAQGRAVRRHRSAPRAQTVQARRRTGRHHRKRARRAAHAAREWRAAWDRVRAPVREVWRTIREDFCPAFRRALTTTPHQDDYVLALPPKEDTP